jgi:hypothetical protein
MIGFDTSGSKSTLPSSGSNELSIVPVDVIGSIKTN